MDKLKDKLLKNREIILKFQENELNKCKQKKISKKVFKFLIKYTIWISFWTIIIVLLSKILINFSNDINLFSLGNILISSILALFSIFIKLYIKQYKEFKINKKINFIYIDYKKIIEYISFYIITFLIFLTLSIIPNFYSNIFNFLGCYTYMYLPFLMNLFIFIILIFIQLIFNLNYINKKNKIIKKYNKQVKNIDSLIKNNS